MLTIIIRAIIIYFIVLLIYRLMGKRQLGQMQPFEFVLTLIIADLATIPMAVVSVPVLHGIVPLLTLVVIYFVLTVITKSSQILSKFISGKPSIIINPKGIDYEAIKKLNLSTDDIFASLRECGYFNISQIQYAIMETNGKVSVMPKSEFSPVTNQNLNLQVDESFIPIILVSEGKLSQDNIKLAGYSEEEVINLIKENSNEEKIKNILLLTVDQTGNGYIQTMKDAGKSFQTQRLVQNDSV